MDSLSTVAPLDFSQSLGTHCGSIGGQHEEYRQTQVSRFSTQAGPRVLTPAEWRSAGMLAPRFDSLEVSRKEHTKNTRTWHRQEQIGV